jgi:hypothetical protein
MFWLFLEPSPLLRLYCFLVYELFLRTVDDLDDSMAVMHTFFLCVVDAACVSS